MIRQLTLGMALLGGTAIAASAADMGAPAQMGLTGAGEIALLINSYSQTDDGVAATIPGFYGNVFVNAPVTDNLTWGFDIQGQMMKRVDSTVTFDSDTVDTEMAAGTNLIYNMDAVHIGAFGAAGWTNSIAPVTGFGFQVGGLVGVDVSPDTLLYAKGGYAEIKTDLAAPSFEGFRGWFAHVGAVHSFSDSFAVGVSGGYGASNSYEDNNDPGHYWNGNIKAALKISDTMPLFATASYDYNQFTAQDPDFGEEHVFKLGLAIGLGGNGKASSVFNPYGTTLAPYRSAGYAQVLD